ncbi:anti-sigma factor [Mycobacterium shigaense]|uniref:Anti-sigma-K factor RskA n=1 Tax=Mycobacterium shigaense TaxID=722731 RepID=A0A1Z4ECZ3_9MYCO|nr:anti-sigma factor [Mycobacterium shigaense]MEA1122307.1 anti-sigma factor [Mycobacterium shigaense]PRI16981.1 anti-sigma factor [Mycobacterium shigaense]BAX90829.1 anti-sigma-K factor RskA [Mycobacterium shigaense]
MTDPNEFELLELAAPYALHAVTDAERADIDRRVAAAPSPIAAAFADEVRAVRETMAVLSAATSAEPPAQLRTTILGLAQPAASAKRSVRWRTTVVVSVAAAIVAGLTALGVQVLLRPSAAPSLAQQVLAAPDVRTVSAPLGTGNATVMFSHDRNAGVLVMNDVPPPAPGTVYQMWLIGANGPKSVGTMGPAAVTPSTTAMLANIGSSTALAFTVEPGKGSTQPTTAILAELPLR